MIYIRQLTLPALFLLFLYSPLAASAENYVTKFCDSCVTESDFANSANSVSRSVKVLVFNLEDREVRAYNLHYDSWIGFVPLPLAVPTEAYEAIDAYHEIKNYFLEGVPTSTQSNKSLLKTSTENTSSWTLGFGPVCGPADNPPVAGRIPDGIFKNACQAHDDCYSSGGTKGLCDSVFKTDLEFSAETYSAQILDPIMRAVVNEALLRVANIYVDAVVKSEEAHDAYCGIPGNANSQTCSASPYTGTGSYHNMISTEQGYSGYSYYFSSLWYRCYNYRVTYSDGSQSYLQQCDLTY